ncbi:FecR family protein [Pseudomonas citronellolis]|uniref:FecR family protein n=1 Tax=Pseudomonas citronellolis TaxID=53408 RepID=UPI0023E3B909|nr:FecR family protein [Pseudomonas citronellolis]MDF3937103.1 FecR family protein [Pseudomonas citronellolis]
MTQLPSEQDDERLSAEAAHWCARLHDEDCSAAEREAFAAWHAADPRHREEYQAMLDIWQLADGLQAPVAAPSLAAPPRPLARPRRRPLRRIAAAAAVACIALGAAWSAGWSAGWLPARVGYYAAQDKPREVILADDSRVQLNAHSSLFFAQYRDHRDARLGSGGEAYFRVTHDSLQPFTVRTENGSVRVTGTRFNVWTDPSQMLVTLLEGSVVVSPPAGVDSNSAQLTPGMQARYSKASRQFELAQVAPGDAIAWIDGRLVLEDQALQAAIPLINRYLPHPVRLDDPTVAAMRIGGIYDTSDLQALVDSLPKVLPVDLRKRSDGSIVLASKFVPL